MPIEKKVPELLGELTDAITAEGVLNVETTLLLGDLVPVSVEVTRPNDTTPYNIGDVVSNATSGSALATITNIARANDVGGYIVAARLTADLKSITPRIRVHLFKASDPTFSHDNVAAKSVYADEAKRVAVFDLPAMSTPADTTNSDMSTSYTSEIRLPFTPNSGGRNLYAMLETRDAFTPKSGGKFTLTLWADQN